jgi:hypothetical protein
MSDKTRADDPHTAFFAVVIASSPALLPAAQLSSTTL